MYSEFKLDTKDGAVLFCRKWIPEQDVKATMVLIHGKGENTGRYLSFGAFLAENGIAVFAPDLRGHGLSSGKVGHTGPREEVLNDIDLLVKTAQKTYPEKSVFVYGHSMGGNLVLDYRRTRGKDVKAYVISSPWLNLKKRLPLLAKKVIFGIAKVMPYLTIPTGIDVTTISSVEAEQKRYAEDKSMNAVITASTFRDIEKATLNIFSDASHNPKPFVLIHGAEDGLVDIEGSRTLAQLSGKACEYHEFKGCRHEILNDVGAEEAKQTMLNYMLSRVE